MHLSDGPWLWRKFNSHFATPYRAENTLKFGSTEMSWIISDNVFLNSSWCHKDFVLFWTCIFLSVSGQWPRSHPQPLPAIGYTITNLNNQTIVPDSRLSLLFLSRKGMPWQQNVNQIKFILTRSQMQISQSRSKLGLIQKTS